MKKQAIDSEGSMDRISQLPQPLLHEILYFLSQKEAVQTSVLSKSWRYLGSTRPNLHFDPRLFDGNEETFRSVLRKTLQRYLDQKLSIQEFCLATSGVNSKSISFLNKWIPIVLLHMGVKTFDLSFLHIESAYFKLPHVVFQSETLQSLSLYLCKLTQTPLDSVILCKHLKKLFFDRVYIADETMAMILSNCRLIETFVLRRCKGLRNIKLDGQISLKLFEFEILESLRKHDHSIEINVPILETVRITLFPSWFNHHKHLFPHLKSLYLKFVRFSSSSFDSFSSNFPCLEKLSLIHCYGFDELQLSSRSIKKFIVEYGCTNTLKAVIDAPSLVGFKCRGHEIPQCIFLQETACKLKVEIVVRCDMTANDYAASWWCRELYEFLKPFSKSIISLYIGQELAENVEDMEEEVEEEEVEEVVEVVEEGEEVEEEEEEEEEEVEEEEEEEETNGGLCEPVVVERLVLSSDECSPSFLKNLKRVCIARK
ncbi:hypothetical protein CASFOL_013032 [Castilleja foliolosa]|uniref:F-box domain-containing protein n=1 Tax=Castilleja foliolosa TaxID=1961234 RepID=A0ABD3DKM7_9LAMI